MLAAPVLSWLLLPQPNRARPGPLLSPGPPPAVPTFGSAKVFHGVWPWLPRMVTPTKLPLSMKPTSRRGSPFRDSLATRGAAAPSPSANVAQLEAARPPLGLLADYIRHSPPDLERYLQPPASNLAAALLAAHHTPVRPPLLPGRLPSAHLAVAQPPALALVASLTRHHAGLCLPGLVPRGRRRCNQAGDVSLSLPALTRTAPFSGLDTIFCGDIAMAATHGNPNQASAIYEAHLKAGVPFP